MKKFLPLLLILIIALSTGCQKKAEETASPSPVAEKTAAVTEEKTPEPAATVATEVKEKIETWTGSGNGNYEMLLEDFPVKMSWDMEFKEVSMEVYKDNTFSGKGKILLLKKDVAELSFEDGTKIGFSWDKTEYEFTFTGKKEGDKYIIDKFPEVPGKIKSTGNTLNSSEYTPPLFYVGKSLEITDSNNSLDIKHTESTSPKGVKELKGDLFIQLIKS
ncbi:MAG: hypothetical protein ABRQ38_20470 [Candidatus Eremiobacterota bacterium]